MTIKRALFELESIEDCNTPTTIVSDLDSDLSIKCLSFHTNNSDCSQNKDMLTIKKKEEDSFYHCSSETYSEESMSTLH